MIFQFILILILLGYAKAKLLDTSVSCDQVIFLKLNLTFFIIKNSQKT